MRPLSAAELLSAWERGSGQPPHERALRVLTAACPDRSFDELASLNIGERDARLLKLREWTIGEEFTALLTCPACGNRLELKFNIADIRVAPIDESRREREAEGAEPFGFVFNDYEVRFRLPNSLDLAAIGLSGDITDGRQRLLKRCVLSARHHDAKTDVQDLPDEILEAIAARMETADPQADVQLNSICAVCAHEWKSVFDIESFFWSEIQAWAKSIMREVHTLARAYCWREQDILAMSPHRRQFYLGMLSG
jgi:hypothetical protein